MNHVEINHEPFADGKRFTYRRNDQIINGIFQECYEVYSRGLQTWAFCFLESEVEIIVKALNQNLEK